MQPRQLQATCNYCALNPFDQSEGDVCFSRNQESVIPHSVNPALERLRAVKLTPSAIILSFLPRTECFSS